MSLRIEQDRRLCRIALAAPEKRNIFYAALAAAFLQELRDASEDANTGAILIEADGPVFCGGADPISPPGEDLYTFGRTAKKPIIVGIKGAAVSAGLAIIANAHVAIAAQGVTFGLTDIRDGRWNEGAFRAVAGAIGERRALELTMTGRIFNTADATAWGLIHSTAPAFEIEDRVTELATALANANAEVIRAALSLRS